jgi:hypothetical protein
VMPFKKCVAYPFNRYLSPLPAALVELEAICLALGSPRQKRYRGDTEAIQKRYRSATVRRNTGLH